MFCYHLNSALTKKCLIRHDTGTSTQIQLIKRISSPAHELKKKGIFPPLNLLKWFSWTLDKYPLTSGVSASFSVFLQLYSVYSNVSLI